MESNFHFHDLLLCKPPFRHFKTTKITSDVTLLRLRDSRWNLQQEEINKNVSKFFKLISLKFLTKNEKWNLDWIVASISNLIVYLYPARRTEEIRVSKTFGYFCLEQTVFLWIVCVARIVLWPHVRQWNSLHDICCFCTLNFFLLF